MVSLLLPTRIKGKTGLPVVGYAFDDKIPLRPKQRMFPKATKGISMSGCYLAIRLPLIDAVIFGPNPPRHPKMTTSSGGGREKRFRYGNTDCLDDYNDSSDNTTVFLRWWGEPVGGYQISGHGQNLCLTARWWDE